MACATFDALRCAISTKVCIILLLCSIYPKFPRNILQFACYAIGKVVRPQCSANFYFVEVVILLVDWRVLGARVGCAAGNAADRPVEAVRALAGLDKVRDSARGVQGDRTPQPSTRAALLLRCLELAQVLQELRLRDLIFVIEHVFVLLQDVVQIAHIRIVQYLPLHYSLSDLEL